MKIWGQSLRFKFSVGFIVTVLIPALTASAVLTVYEYNALQRQAEDSVTLIGSLKSQEVASRLIRLKLAAEDLTLQTADVAIYQRAVAADAGATEIDAARRQLEAVWTDTLSVAHIWLINSSLGVVADRGREDASLRREALARIGGSVPETTVLGIYPSLDNEPFLDILIPIRDGNRTVGYLVMTQNLARAGNDVLPNLYEVLANQPELRNTPQAFIALLSNDGFLVGSTRRNEELFDNFRRHPAMDAMADLRVDRFGNALDQGDIGAEHYRSPLLEEEVIGHYERVPETQWTLLVEMERDEVVEPLLPFSLYLLGIGFGLVMLLNALWTLFLYQSIEPPLTRLRRATTFFAAGERAPELKPLERADEVGQLHNTFAQLADGVQQRFAEMEQQQAAQQAELDLFLAAAHLVRTVQDPAFLLEEWARLLNHTYTGVDYAQVFLVDEQTHSLSLKTGTGDEGRRMLLEGHRYALDNRTVPGHVAITHKPLVVADLSRTPQYFRSPTLSPFHAELALPLHAGERMIGVLDLYSRQSGAFTEQDVAFLSALTVGLAVALSRLFIVPEQVAAIQPDGQSVRSAWQEYYVQRRAAALSAVGGTARARPPDTREWTPVQQQAIQTGQVAIVEDWRGVTFALPILLRDEVLGAVEWTVEADHFSYELVDMARELVERLALAADNARLFEQSQRLIERERVVNQISQKLSVQTDIKQILQVAVKELGLALGTPETMISLKIDAREPS